MSTEKNGPGFQFDNTYAKLPEAFFVQQAPVPVRLPKMVIFNSALAKTLGLNEALLSGDEGAEIFAGNKIPAGATPLAQAYAGHQFGHFTMLGDGRAVLLGEHLTPDATRFDIQLKGSGQTPFSRRGDGRAALGPMLREYIISEAMHALGIPTTRSLAVVTTGEITFREKPLPGAVLARVASSHIRVGTFEYAAAIEEETPGSLKALADYTLQRHYPELTSSAEPYLALLNAVMERQAKLIAQWMQVGFIHGVMNTDNMALSGETIDYGPCAFMDQYSLETLFSSIDRNGRYAFGNQARIAQWNLARLAEALLPLLNASHEAAVAKAKTAIEAFPALFQRHWLSRMRAKLGLGTEQPDDAALVGELLRWMQEAGADYTNSFRALAEHKLDGEPKFKDPKFLDWHGRWKKRREQEPEELSQKLMRQSNPCLIPRNHRVEQALEAAVERDDLSLVHALLDALRCPYDDNPQFAGFKTPPPPSESAYQTFCGT